ncbi:MAG: ABC transporter substrate-binding protein [Xanthobacteraceae bacterium]|nr:ABC transporter substrate-binding protein [Xanthobacteraceae bacterium]
MISRRRALVAIGAGLPALLPSVSLAQQSGVRRVGFLAIRSRSTATNPDAYYDAFLQGMREAGYVEGRNLAIEWRFAEGKYERLPGLAADLVRAKVEVIVTHGTVGTRAAQRTTNSIPIVAAAVGDPVAGGFAASLARPGGNVTGLSTIIAHLAEKQVELLKTMIPALSRVAILMNFDNASHSANLQNARAEAKKTGMTILPVDARTSEAIERGFATMTRDGAEAVIIASDPFYTGQRWQFAALAAKSRLPSMFPYREYVEAGGLMSYGPDAADSFRYAATFVDKILKGAKPADLPFEQPTRYYLAINLKTAKEIGVTVPISLLTRAEDVIE